MSTSDLIGTAEIAEMLGVCRAHATNRITKLPTFPKPVVDLTQRVRRWRKRDVEKWAFSKLVR